MALNLTLRKSFLYIFATVGLVIAIIGAVSLINLGLKSYVFTKADYPCAYNRPYPVNYKDPNQPNLTQAEIDRANADAEKTCIEQRTSDKQRQAADAIAMLVVGVPLYFYHWHKIKAENQI